MGNYIMATRPQEKASYSHPQLRLPFSDITAQIGHHDGDPKCFPFQLRFLDCTEAYGREMGKEKCKFLYQDFVECVKQWKQRARISDMMERRYQLWFQGIRGQGPEAPLFYETPRYDGYVPNMLYYDANWY